MEIKSILKNKLILKIYFKKYIHKYIDTRTKSITNIAVTQD